MAESHLIALPLLISGTPLRHAYINGVSPRSGLWCKETRDVVHEVLVNECFCDRRPVGMRGLGLGALCSHIAVQVPRMQTAKQRQLPSIEASERARVQEIIEDTKFIEIRHQ